MKGKVLILAFCPLIQKDCLKKGCSWWAPGAEKCGVVYTSMLVENLHDLGVTAHKEFVPPPDEEPVIE
jgi:hypothetical protein